MLKIQVKAKIDGGVHLKYGEIKAGQTYEIDDVDFGDELFVRPKGFESPHEKADRERREQEERDRKAAEAEVAQPSGPPENASIEAEKQEGGK